MRRSPVFLVDADGVLADFFVAISREAARFGQEIPVEKFTHYDACFQLLGRREGVVRAAISTPGWCTAIPPYDGAWKLCDALRALGNVYCLTSPWRSATWYDERVNWLADNVNIQRERVIFADDKAMVRGDFLIDDRLEHIWDWCEANPSGTGILVDRPWNRSWCGARPILGANAVRVPFEDILRAVRANLDAQDIIDHG